VDAGTFWLSPTPDVPSIYPGAGTVRIASWVKLDDHLSGQQIFVLNTHLDNVSNTANVYSANLIRDRLPGLAGDAPIVLTGDMNSTETSSVVRTLLGQNDPGEFQLGDAFREVHPVVGTNERTYHAYSGGSSGSRIDFVLHSDALTPTGASIIRTTYDGRYPSDHYPVTAEFTMLVVPEPASAALFLVGFALTYLARRWAGRRA
jgi:endonuclease/exonuclease/phosphatase family metal-dependent hydrolase